MIIGLIRGQVIAAGEIQQGVGKSGKQWQKQILVVQSEGAYPKKVAFSIMNDKIAQANIQIGNIVEAEVSIESREYNGKWYTDLNAYRVDNMSVGAPVQTYQQAAQNQSVYQQSAPQGYTAAQNPHPANPFGQPASSGDMPF